MRLFGFGVLAGTMLAAFLYAGAWYFLWDIVAPPPVECDVPTAEWCEDTQYAHWSDLDGRPSSMRAHAARPEWAQSVDLGFQAAEWAVTVERYFGSPITAACYHMSDTPAACFAKERPYDPWPEN